MEHLPSLVAAGGRLASGCGTTTTSLLLEQFIEHWGKPCYDYCAEHDLEFTGHYWEHGWPDAGARRRTTWPCTPGTSGRRIDILMNQYAEGVHAQFGNVRARPRAGQRGQPARPQADALRGLRRRRLGPAVRGHEADRRLALRAGREHAGRAPLLHHDPRRAEARPSAVVLLPRAVVGGLPRDGRLLHAALGRPCRTASRSTTSWSSSRPPPPGCTSPTAPQASSWRRSARRFQDLVTALERAQVEYDLGCEEIIGPLRLGRAAPSWCVGQRAYDTVVLPPTTENLNGKTLDLITAFAKAGGRVIACGPPPTRCEGVESPDGAVSGPVPRLEAG